MLDVGRVSDDHLLIEGGRELDLAGTLHPPTPQASGLGPPSVSHRGLPLSASCPALCSCAISANQVLHQLQGNLSQHSSVHSHWEESPLSVPITCLTSKGVPIQVTGTDSGSSNEFTFDANLLMDMERDPLESACSWSQPHIYVPYTWSNRWADGCSLENAVLIRTPPKHNYLDIQPHGPEVPHCWSTI